MKEKVIVVDIRTGEQKIEEKEINLPKTEMIEEQPINLSDLRKLLNWAKEKRII